MPRFNCEEEVLLEEVIQSTIDCLLTGGFRVGYWTTFSQVDWASSTITDGVITAIVMNAGGLWKKLEVDPKTATFNHEYTKEQQFGIDTVLMTFESLANKRAVQSGIQTGCIVFYVQDNNCKQWIIGVDFINGAIVRPVTSLSVGRFRVEGGLLGSTLAHLELDLTGESFFGPIETTVLPAALLTELGDGDGEGV